MTNASISPASIVPRERLVVFLLFVVPVLLFVAPALPRFFSAAIGLPYDTVLNLWTFRHITDAVLLRDEPLFSTMRLLAPIGSTLALHDMAILPSFAVSPVTAFAGTFAGFNLLLVLAQLWAGTGAFVLVRQLTGSRLSGAFAAFLIESSPILYYRMINHYSLTYIGFISIFIWLVLRAFDPDDPVCARRIGLLAGATAVACFLTSFNIFVLSFFTAGGIWVVLLAAALIQRSRTTATRLLKLVLYSGIVAVPFLYAWAVASPVQDARFWWKGEPDVAVATENGALPAYFLTPNPRFWLFAKQVSGFPEVADGNHNPERFVHIGIVNLALFAAGMIFLLRRRRAVGVALLIVALLCVNLSLGYGSVNPRDVDAAERVSPLLLFPKFLGLPLMNQARVPARWAFPLITLVVAVAGCGMHGLLVRLCRPAWRLALVGAICVVAALETAHTATPTNGFELPKAYEAIGVAQHPTDMIIEWPIYFFCGMKGPTGFNYDRARMVWALEHRYRIVSGYLSRIPLERLKSVVNQPLLRDLWMIQGDGPGMLTDTEPTDLKTIQRWLMLNNVYFIVLNKQANYQQALEYLQKNNITEPGYEDDQYVVLKIAR